MGRKRNSLLADVEERASFLSEIGVEFAAAPRKPSSPSEAPSTRLLSSDPAGKESLLGPVHEEVLNCRLCPLSRQRKNAVPGEGYAGTEVLFVGEAPGHDEDIQGRPFVGRAGQLLTKIITAMELTREKVFITNVVKCRPPKNRTPQREEVEACAPYLLRQIEIIGPRVIVALGKVSADFFIPGRQSMTLLRGNFHEFRGIPVMPTFHPSYLVRNEGNRGLRRLVWEDMKKVMARLGRK